jgi:hypothetical protein
MGQEHDDYADPDSSQAWLHPAVVRLLAALVLMVVLFGFCLLISLFVDVD